jgi:4-hydroxybenzoate polyprenyltransferase
MIQRKQTLYMLLAAIAAGVCGGMMVNMTLMLGAFVAAIVLLLNIFLYKRRTKQASVCVFVMFLLALWYVNLATIRGSVELTWPMALPVVSIVLVFLARKAILADEKLVRSLDRIR